MAKKVTIKAGANSISTTTNKQTTDEENDLNECS
jgi:hypothetical protein